MISRIHHQQHVVGIFSLLCLFLIQTLPLYSAVSIPASPSFETSSPSVLGSYVTAIKSDTVLDRWGQPVLEGKPEIESKDLATSENWDGFNLLVPSTVFGGSEIKDESVLIETESLVSRPSFQIMPQGFEVSWNQSRLIQYLSAGVYWSDMEWPRVLPGFQRLKNWAGRNGIHFNPLTEGDESTQDFSSYLSANIEINPKMNIQLDQYGSRTNFLVKDDFAGYDYQGMTVRLNYKVNDYLKSGIGYDLSYNKYAQAGYEQQGLSYAPMGDIELTPFKNIPGFKSFAFKIFGEMRMGRYDENTASLVRSVSQSTGFGIHWDVRGIQINPGIAFRNEIADLHYPDPDHVIHRYLTFSKAQKWGKLTTTPYVSWSLDSKQSLSGNDSIERFSQRIAFGTNLKLTKDLSLDHSYSLLKGTPFYHTNDPDPKRFQMDVDLKYKLLGVENKIFLIHLGYGSFFYSQSPENNSEATLACAFHVDF